MSTDTDVNDMYVTDDASGENWTLMLGDSCERMAELADDSMDLSVCSPPFASLYTYSPSPRDLGNCATRGEFLEHYKFIIREQLRVTKPGRLACVHVQQVTTRKNTEGFIGLTDFRGEVIRAFQDSGWIFFGEVTIWKNPQALRHGQRVLTPTGWTPIESLAVGDQVIGSDGTPTKVEGVWPQGRGDVYRVTFSDGASVECDAAHRWTVRGLGARKSGRWQTLTTAELMDGGLRAPCGYRRWEIPIVRPVQFSPAPDLPLHPYVLGALLGDGNVTQRSSVSLHTQRAIAARVATLLPEGHTIREQDRTGKGDDSATFHIGHPAWHRNDVLSALRELEVQGLRAWEKRVPAAYLTASAGDRRALLSGLLDTDGTVKRNGAIWFGSTSEGLARDVAELVRSLGGIARIRCETARRYRHNGEDRNGRPAWLVSIALDGDPLVTLPGKAARWRVSRRAWHREIASIEPAGTDDRTCITVGADDGLFVTEGYAVTHNSQATRTKAHSLMFVSKNRDSAGIRPALADYLLIFKKPGDNAVPIPHEAMAGEVTNNDWIEWASPIWFDQGDGGGLGGDNLSPAWTTIRETNTLNERVAREDADERHLCPLQLDLIERCVRLWSNRGETVFSPFAGIGSELWAAVKLGRKGAGIELKASYWRTAVDNLTALDSEMGQETLFSMDEL
jgi:hypothetical protein